MAALVLTSVIAALACSFVGFRATVRVSVSSAGTEGNGASGEYSAPAISANGRFVAFDSRASNLVEGDANGAIDVFVRDLATNETTCVSVSYSGGVASGESAFLSMSDDGRYVAFCSSAPDIVPGDTNARQDVFLRDTILGETTIVSVSSALSFTDADSYGPDVSGDGSRVAFYSYATNLVDGDSNGTGDVFVRNLATGETTRVSVSSLGVEGNGLSRAPAVSRDGRWVAFQSQASNLVAGDTNGVEDIFLHDLQTGETTRASVTRAGEEATSASYNPALSGDGRFVAFNTEAPLVPEDTNGWADVFVFDRLSCSIERVSVSSTGEDANGMSVCADISANGRYVLFYSSANNLVDGDTNGMWDVFVHDRWTGRNELVSVSSTGEQGNWPSTKCSFSADGRYVAFSSEATNLVSNDANDASDVFVRDRMAESSFAISSASVTLARYGDAFVLSGKLHGGGAPLAGKRVVLQTAPASGGPWRDSAVSAITAADGSFSLKHVPRSLTFYRARFAGDGAEYSAAVSGVRYAKPRAWVSNPIAPYYMYRYRSRLVYGYLKPRHVAGTRPVRIYRYRYEGGRWVGYGYVLARAYNYATYTKYAVYMTLPRRGLWRLRAYHPADTGHAASWSSGYEYVRVR